MATLWDSLERSATTHADVHWWNGDGFGEESWMSVVARAREVAAGLRKRGIRPGACVACVLTNTSIVAATAFGAWLAGATVASLPLPSRGRDPDDYVSGLARICEQVGAEWLLVEARYMPLLPSRVGPARVDAYERLPASLPVPTEPPGPDDIAFIQYSSGSTAEPKGCLITTRAIESQLELLRDWLSLASRERGAMWLPFSHDMGFFGGLLLFWSNGLSGVVSAPERFIASPKTWLGDCASFQATLTVCPDFALQIAARHPPQPTERLRVRACLVGGERIHWDHLAAMRDLLTELGAAATALTPAYGLAEATLAVTLGRPDEEAKAKFVCMRRLLDGAVVGAGPDEPGTVAVVSVGHSLPNIEVTISGSEPVGEILVRSPSLAQGYVADGARTNATFADRHLRTGDIGFMEDGELYVIGRADDQLSVAGRNVLAREVEAKIAGVPGLRDGSCVLIDAYHEIVCACELEGSVPQDLGSVADELARRIRSVGGIAIAECVFFHRGRLPKTPSGKVQRFRCRDLVLSANSAVIAARVRTE